MATEADHLAAVLKALDEAGASPYTIQQEQRVKVLPPNYTQVTLERRFGGVLRVTATIGTRGYRFTLRACGRTHEDAVRMRDLSRSAVEFACLTIDGISTTPIQFEASSQFELDDDRYYSGIESFTYVH